MKATVQVTLEITIDIGSKRSLPMSQVLDEIRVSAHNVASDRDRLMTAMTHGHAKIVGDPGTVRIVTVDDQWLKG